MQNNSAQVAMENHFLSVLLNDGPSPMLGDAANTYGWLVGSWDLRVVDYDNDGSRREQRGEWHFAWVLEGRAMQDVFIVPRRRSRNASTKDSNRYGSTLRIYDSAIDVWRVTWSNPVTGARNELLGRKIDDKIVQDGVDGEGQRYRWIFDNITSDSFHWYGERSSDGGVTYTLEVEFFAVRER